MNYAKLSSEAVKEGSTYLSDKLDSLKIQAEEKPSKSIRKGVRICRFKLMKALSNEK